MTTGAIPTCYRSVISYPSETLAAVVQC